MFQTLRERIGYLYSFDIPQALEAAGLSVDDGQADQLRHGFSLSTGDLITFEQFRHMAELIRDGRLPPTQPMSPPPEDEEPRTVPGQKGYKAEKAEGGKKKKGDGPAPPPPRGNPPHHQWMATKMGDYGRGVELPDAVKRQFYNEYTDKPSLLVGYPANKKYTQHDTVAALDDNSKPLPPPKKEPQPDLEWSPYRNRGGEDSSPWHYAGW